MADGQTYTQKGRPIAVKTPLPDDTLLLVGISGREGLSQLFSFHLDMLTEDRKAKDVSFDKLIGKSITVTLTRSDKAKSKRFFNGICSRISETGKAGEFTAYQMEIVPKLWLSSRKSHSRIFQNETVPNILKDVLSGIQPKFEIHGKFEPRNYCVQYRETDFNFVSRLMEEEGIYYFFTHAHGQHTMVVADTPQHPALTPIRYDEVSGGTREDEHIFSWQKVQELRTGKYTLWDHHFQAPDKTLEANESGVSSVQVGKVSHQLVVEANRDLELYDFPGEYAQRFDGINRGGGEQTAEVNKIFEDNKRTAKIRMQQEEVSSLVIHGAGNCGHLLGGHKFKLDRHPTAEGEYVVTSVNHTAQAGDFRSDSTDEFTYQNSFSCIPVALPFRPLRNTPKPMIPGAQTAVVVGPSGEEIFTDKYGRVKVQFFWDRDGKKNEQSSCWVRVATTWAGGKWGGIHIPRIGQEVVVAFVEADPDAPIIVGSVYNSDQMPPYELPANKTQSGIKTRSTLNGSHDNFNEIRFEDKKGQEQLFVHAERNQDIEVEKDETHWVGHDRKKKIDNDETTTIGRDRKEDVGKNETISVGENRSESVGKNEDISIGKNRTENVSENESVTIGKNRTEQVGKNEEVSVGENRSHTVGKNDQLDIGKQLLVTAGDSITFNTGSASLILKKNGDIQLRGNNILVDGSGKVNVKASGDVVLKGAKVTQN
ncbi:MAG TPA: type VI secretion system tip protein TssI/VgrG [Nitrospira sp.]|nr:type VI secretion system tip protein TssI/VgrG [Nitrospira sp.]